MKTILAAGLLLLLSCGVEKETTSNEVEDHVQDREEATVLTQEAYNVQIQFYYFTPYCGGAAPDPEMENFQTSPQGNTIFLFLDLNTNEKKEVKSDANGILRLHLPEGKYAIREKYKDIPYAEFKAQHYREPDQNYFDNTDTNCYYNWWASNLLEFEITKPDSLYDFTHTTYTQCFTGNNPCISYMGPYPP